MDKSKKLGKNFVLLTIGSFSSKLLTFLLVPLYTSVLSTAEYGIVDLINSTVSLIYPLAILVISEAVIRFCLDSSSDQKQVWSVGFLVTLAGCALMVLLSPIVLTTGLRNHYLFFVLQCITLSFHSTVSQFVKGLDKVKHYAIGGILSTAVVVSLNILFLLIFKWGLSGYMIAMVSGHLASTLYYVFSLRLWRYFVPLKQIDFAFCKNMLRYSVPMLPNSISWWISDSSDKYIVRYFCGIAVNGIYAVSYKIPSMLTTITTLFVGAWQISAFEDFNEKESQSFFSTVTDNFLKLTLLVASGLVFLTKPIARLLFAAEFYEAWRFTPVLILAFVFSTTSSFIGTVYTAAKKTKMLFYSTLIAALANIVVDLCLVPIMGAMGAAIATALSYAIICVIRFVDSRKIMKLLLDWKRIFLSLSLLIAQICLVILIDSWTAVAVCGVFTLVMLLINRQVFISAMQKLLKKFTK